MEGIWACAKLLTFGAYYDDSLAGCYELRRDDDGVEIRVPWFVTKLRSRTREEAFLTGAIEEAWHMSPSITLGV